MATSLVHADISKRIIGSAFEVHGVLGPGFIESFYEEALVNELSMRGIAYRRQVEVPVWYKGSLIGTHRLDLLVEDCVIVELKTIMDFADIHISVARAYLAAANLSLALLLNFSKPSLEFKRVIINPRNP